MEPLVVKSDANNVACDQVSEDQMLSNEIDRQRLGRLEDQQSEMRGALTQVQIGLGKIDNLAETMAKFIERSDIMSDRSEKSLIRIHDRIDSVQKEVSAEIQFMRKEVQEMHDNHRDGVDSKINTAVQTLGNHVDVIDGRSAQTKTELDTWRAEIRGMARVAGWGWAVMGGGVIALGVFVLKMYFTQGN